MELAEELGIEDYPCPAGGCRLTDPGYGARIRDLLEHDTPLLLDEVRLLKVGRHFRIDAGTKVVVGRNEDENRLLDGLFRENDLRIELADIPGPLTLFRGPGQEDKIRLAAGITARYSKAREKDSVNVNITAENDGDERIISVKPAEEGSPGAYRIER